MTLTILPLLSRHLEPLAETFPERDYQQFEQDYLNHLQEKHLLLVAEYREEEELFALGYVTVIWEASYTPFWRRRIPEIIALHVGEPFQGNGIGSDLLLACEREVARRGYRALGVSLPVDPAFQPAMRLFGRAGYQQDGLGITPEDNALHFLRLLD
jgi:GNAT superfamily N-acetyltransferase